MQRPCTPPQIPTALLLNTATFNNGPTFVLAHSLLLITAVQSQATADKYTLLYMVEQSS